MSESMNLMNMFKSSVQKEADSVLKEHDKLEKEINALAVAARACIGSELFVGYRKQYEELEKKMLVAMINDTNNATLSAMPMEQYGAVMFRSITRLMVLRSIIDVVERDSKRGTIK